MKFVIAGIELAHTIDAFTLAILNERFTIDRTGRIRRGTCSIFIFNTSARTIQMVIVLASFGNTITIITLAQRDIGGDRRIIAIQASRTASCNAIAACTIAIVADIAIACAFDTNAFNTDTGTA